MIPALRGKRNTGQGAAVNPKRVEEVELGRKKGALID
jgi:hypothetical protein